jgi:hypothetical protein
MRVKWEAEREKREGKRGGGGRDRRDEGKDTKKGTGGARKTLRYYTRLGFIFNYR